MSCTANDTRLVKKQLTKLFRRLNEETPCTMELQRLRDLEEQSQASKYLAKVKLETYITDDLRVATFKVGQQDAEIFNLRQAFNGAHRYIAVGEYTQLIQGGTLWMSDTPVELLEHIPVVDEVYKNKHRDVLILGLGLGVVVQAVLDMRHVKECVVVEKNEHILKVIGPQYEERYGTRLRLVRADAYRWKPDKHYGAVWADIWPTLSTDNIRKISNLRKRYGGACDWFGAWGETFLRLKRAEEDKTIRRIRSWQKKYAQGLEG